MNYGLLQASVDVGNERLQDAVSYALGHSISGGHTTAAHEIAEQLKSGSLKSDSIVNNTAKQAALVQKLKSMSVDVNSLLNQSKVVYSDVGSGAVDQYTDQEITDLQAKINRLRRESSSYIDLSVIDSQINGKDPNAPETQYFQNLKTGVQNFNSAMREAANMVSSITSSYNAAKNQNSTIQSELTKAKADFSKAKSDGQACVEDLRDAKARLTRNPNPTTRKDVVESSDKLTKTEAQLNALQQHIKILKSTNDKILKETNAKRMKKIIEDAEDQRKIAAANAEKTRLDVLMTKTVKQWWGGHSKNRPVPVEFEVWWRKQNKMKKMHDDDLRLYNISSMLDQTSYMRSNRYDLREPRKDIPLVEVDETFGHEEKVGGNTFSGFGSTARKAHGDGPRARFGSTARQEPVDGQRARFGSTARQEPVDGQRARFGSTARQEPVEVPSARFGSTARQEPVDGQRARFGSTVRQEPVDGQRARFGSTARQEPYPINTQGGSDEETTVNNGVFRKAGNAARATGRFAAGAAGGVRTRATAARDAAGAAAGAVGGVAGAAVGATTRAAGAVGGVAGAAVGATTRAAGAVAGAVAGAAGGVFGRGSDDDDEKDVLDEAGGYYSVLDQGDDDDVLDEADLGQGRQERRPAVTGVIDVTHDGLSEEERLEIVNDTIERLNETNKVTDPTVTQLNWNYGKLFSTGQKKIGGKSSQLSNLTDVKEFINNAFSSSPRERVINVANGKELLVFNRLEQGIVNSVYKTFELLIAKAPQYHPTNEIVFTDDTGGIDYRKTQHAFLYIIHRQGLYDLDGKEYISPKKKLTGSYESSPFSSMFLWM